ncbi:FtsX-like permease family protein [Neorhodopirellula pilleata]|uniref:FtsX-like permease family protein n=1 Tax=Neorhodopirellula pilleata TaxID=2714738 RepID=UPI001E527660|nr:FtsX-like permease family protein [Neorhodopirellula pilleata]
MTRTIVSIGGIGFAILLMFMQLGFLGSVGDTATVVLNRMPCQIVVRSPDYLHIYDTSSLPGNLPQLLESVSEVRDALPLDIGVTQWQNPIDHSFRAIAMMGIDLEQPAFELPELTPRMISTLRPVGSVLIDDASAIDFGPANRSHFGRLDVGTTTDVAGESARLAGTFEMGTGLAANGALLASRQTFEKLAPGQRPGRVSLILIRLDDPAQIASGLAAVRNRLQSLGGEASYAQAMTLDEAKAAEKDRWYRQTPIGLIFIVGVGLAVVVGGVISYMVLASDVAAHLPEYATLRAMGYSDGYLVKTLLSQSTLLALVAFPPSVVAAMGLYYVTSIVSSIPIRMTSTWIVVVFSLSLGMCNIAGVIALRKLLKAEPANLF